MIKDKSEYNILIIEDNPGDLFIFQEYLKDQIIDPNLYVAYNFDEAEGLLTSEEINLDIIFLDLSLPDKNGVELIQEIVKLSAKKPIVVLSGYSDVQFSIKSLHLGISDYLVKDDITGLTLYKSLRYNIERSKYIAQLEQSEKRYMDLFQLSPQPMWIFETETFNFLDVNKAALEHYGYTYEEFLKMSIYDLRPKKDFKLFEKYITDEKKKNQKNIKGFFNHQKKNGENIIVEITSNLISHNGEMVRISLANDITDRTKYIKAIEDQNKNLKEIAWIQSHVVRAPLARLMGIMHLLKLEEDKKDKSHFLFEEALKATDELDLIIREITEKTSNIEIDYDKDKI